MPIRGISDVRELPRLGKIRLGTKKLSQKGNEYPDESPEFVLNPIEEIVDKNGNPVIDQSTGKPMVRENEHILALIKLFGPNPAELRIVFPTDDPELICPQYMKWWGGDAKKKKATLTCKGTGDWAYYKGNEPVNGLDVPQYPLVTEELFRHFPHGFNRKCLGPNCPQAQSPGQNKPAKCKANMDLFFLVPEYSFFGVFQITTTSFQAIKAINSCLSVAKNALRLQGIPSISGVPMRLFRKRTPNSQGVNYIMQLEADVKELEVQKQLFFEKKTSTLGVAIERFTINENLLDMPDYDLLPQSEHGRLQTGDDPKAIEAPAVLPPVETIEDWINDVIIVDMFKELGELKGVPVTKAKMKATAKNHDSKEALAKYLEEQLAVGS